MTEPPSLDVVDRDRMNLLGLMLAEIVTANLAAPQGAELARKLNGSLGVTAGKMRVTLGLERGRITMRRGLDDRCRARVHGSLSGLLGVSLGKGALRAFLSGEIGFRGDPLFALGTLPLLRAPAADPPGGGR